jgi:hypothetical protein
MTGHCPQTAATVRSIPSIIVVPSGDVARAGNSHREGSAVSASFESLNSTKQQPKQGA